MIPPRNHITHRTQTPKSRDDSVGDDAQMTETKANTCTAHSQHGQRIPPYVASALLWGLGSHRKRKWTMSKVTLQVLALAVLVLGVLGQTSPIAITIAHARVAALRARAINSPSVVYQPSLDRLSTFVVDNNGRLFDKYYNGHGWVWEDQGTPPGARAINSPSVVYQPSLDRLSAFVVDNNGRLFDKYYNGHGWVWEDQGTSPATS
jgi:hypothetical protein